MSGIDWEAIEREYRAGQLSVREIARQYGASHTAINKKISKKGWTQNLAEKVRVAVANKLVSDEVSKVNVSEAIGVATHRAVEVVRQHRTDLSTGRDLVRTLMQELAEGTAKRDEVLEAIEAETADDESCARRATMLRAVALPSRAGVIRDLASALKHLLPLERQAFALDKEIAQTDQQMVIKVVNYVDP